MQIIILVTTICTFTYCTQSAIWMPYASSFATATQQQIAFLGWSENLVFAISGNLLCILAQKVGYDKCMVLLLLIICLASIVQCIASNFIVLCVAYLISQLSFLFIYLSVAYISSLLPFSSSIVCIAYNYALLLVLGVTAAVCSPLASDYVSYQSVFILNTVLSFAVFIICLLRVFDKQRSIQCSQLEIEQSLQQYYKFKRSQFGKLKGNAQHKQVTAPAADSNFFLDFSIQSHQYERFPVFLQHTNIDLEYSLPMKLEWYFLLHLQFRRDILLLLCTVCFAAI